MSPSAKALRPYLSSAESTLDSWRRKLKAQFDLIDPLLIMAYRTYGDADSIWIRGRVLEDKDLDPGADDPSVWRRLRDAFHRYESDEFPGARLEIDLGSRVEEITTDEEGFFDVRVADLDGVALESPWTQIPLRLVEPLIGAQEPYRTEAHVRVPGGNADFGVISDMDDTVIRTGATNILRRMRIELLNTAKTREPFSGVGAFYRALSDGERNPFFYVSSSPWNLFDLFEEFLRHHDIPLGPILLKDMGLSDGQWLKGGHDGYKMNRIESILEAYPDLPFLLVGDSGQRDAFIYEQVVHDFPGRIRAIYIRDVSDDKRDSEVREVAARLVSQGVDMLLMEDTRAAARHAFEQGWINEEALAEVDREVADNEAKAADETNSPGGAS